MFELLVRVARELERLRVRVVGPVARRRVDVLAEQGVDDELLRPRRRERIESPHSRRVLRARAHGDGVLVRGRRGRAPESPAAVGEAPVLLVQVRGGVEGVE